MEGLEVLLCKLWLQFLKNANEVNCQKKEGAKEMLKKLRFDFKTLIFNNSLQQLYALARHVCFFVYF